VTKAILETKSADTSRICNLLLPWMSLAEVLGDREFKKIRPRFFNKVNLDDGIQV
jgi:hypothetical protein